MSVGGWQEGALAEQPLSAPRVRLGVMAPDPPCLQRNLSLDSSAVVGSDADAFVVRKRLKGPKSECVSVLHSLSSPLLSFPTHFLVALVHEGACGSPFCPPCTLAREAGAAEA